MATLLEVRPLSGASGQLWQSYYLFAYISPITDVGGVRYDEEMLRAAVRDSTSYAGVLRVLGIKQAGGSQAHINRRVKTLGLDTTHFTGQGHAKGNPSPRRQSASDILVKLPLGSLRCKRHKLHRALAESGVPYCCVACGNPAVWRGKPLTLEIHHLNRDFLDNRQTNLQYLCPNCHQQEDAY